MSITIDKTQLAEIAQRRSLDDFDVLLHWADEQIPGPSIFAAPDPEPAADEVPVTVEITPPAPAVALPAEPVPAEPVPPAADSEQAAHDQAVQTVQNAVEAAQAVEQPDEHVAAAKADLAAALAQWPDSPQLQDLQTQLDAIESAAGK